MYTRNCYKPALKCSLKKVTSESVMGTLTDVAWNTLSALVSFCFTWYSFALYQDLVHLLLTVYFQQSSSSFAWKEEAVGRGVLPYINYTGLCRSTGSWFWSFLFRTGYPFQRRFLERGITFRTQESSSFVSSDLKLFKDRLLLRIRFNALTSKLLHSCCTLERSIKNLPISWTGYQC